MSTRYLDSIDSAVLERAKPLRLLTLDVDGVLTEGKLYLSERGESLKAFNTLDGLGIKLLRQAGVEVAIITGRSSPIVSQRAHKLGIEHIYLGCEDKQAAAAELRQKLQLQGEQTAHMGDDLPDLGAMHPDGFAISVPNAHPLLIEHAHYCTERAGGQGAVREVCDVIMLAQGVLASTVARYYPSHV